MTRKQNNVSWKYLEGSDLEERIESILSDICHKTGFKIQKLLQKSAWWGSKEIGAIHYLGTFKDKKAVLKIQGVKPVTSEAYMINSFSKTSDSKLVRPPFLYTAVPWNDKLGYEALILEYIDGKKLVSLPTNSLEIKNYYSVFSDYRQNCLKNPWIYKPDEPLSLITTQNFQKWREASFKIYPNHPLRQPEDSELIDKALNILNTQYKNIEPEFQHAHLSENDLYLQNNQIIVLSNLFWSWRAPFYDAIFAYHWFTYHLASLPDVTPKFIDYQKEIWLTQVTKLPKNNQEKLFLHLALLERQAAGLNLDALSLDPKNPISEYLVESTRKQLQQSIEEFL